MTKIINLFDKMTAKPLDEIKEIKNEHGVACENIKKLLELLDSDQIFKLTIQGLEDERSEELLLFYADSLGTLYEALEEMYNDHMAEINYNED